MRTVRSQGVDIATEAFGDPGDPAVLLVMGATASMLGWPAAFCATLSHRARYVIRYDHRDTGLSTCLPLGRSAYDAEDMADDLLAVLDGYGLEKAHVVGMSLGGYLAQMVALEAPERVASLTLIASEPLGWEGEPLPHIRPELLDHFGRLGHLDWTDAAAVEEFLFTIDRLSAGTTFDAEGARARIRAVMARSPHLPSMFNHATIGLRHDWTGRFRNIRQPVLVIHGAADPVLPPDNGRALAEGIAVARFLSVPGLGHELPDEVLPSLVEILAAHTDL